jgi:hypothetical protein
MAGLPEFNRKIRLYASQVGDIGDAAAKAASREVLFNLVRATPVDQGIAISNWQVGIGSAPSGEIPAYSYGDKGSTATANRAAALTAGMAQIKGYKSGEGKAIHIVNNAKHIGELNKGRSKQAPADFIQTAVLAGRRAVQNLRVSFK